MVAKTVSQHTPTVKECPAIHLEFIGESPAVLSTEVAQRFQKKHAHVLRDIDRIRSQVPEKFYKSNFGRIETDTFLPYSGGIRKDPAYLLTRDAFSLLVMGFTGTAAVRWKLKYIEAFNALEAAALEQRTELAREAGYRQGLDEARGMPAIQAGQRACYLAGMAEGKKLAEQQDGLRLLLRAKAYAQRGFRMAEVARQMGISRQRLQRLQQRARKLAA